MLEFKQKTWIEWAHPGKEHLRLQKFWASTRFQQILPELSNCSGLDHTRCFKKDSPGLVFFYRLMDKCYSMCSMCSTALCI